MSKSAAPRRRGLQSMRCTAPTRRCGCGSLYVRELSAGAAFVPAGFSPGTGDCARGGTDGGTAGRCGIVALARGWHRGSVAALCLGARPASRFWRGFALARLALRFCRGFALIRVWLCVPVAASPLRASGIAFLSRRFALVRVRSLRSCCGAFPRCVFDGAFLSWRFALGSRLSFFLFRKKETACGILRSYSAGRDRHLCVLAVLARLSAFVGSLRAWPFLYGDLDGLPGTRGYEETGLAARRLCAFAQPHWPCESFRWEYAGATRPRLRQRVFDSLDSLHAAAGLCWCGFAAFARLCAIASTL